MHFSPSESSDLGTIKALKEQLILYFEDEIKYDALVEAYLVNYVETFKKSKRMTTSRLALGLRVMREATVL